MTHTLQNISGRFKDDKLRQSMRQSTRQGLQLSSIDVVVQNPLDVFGRLSLAEGHECQRISENEMQISLPGHWCRYSATLSWRPEEALLQLYIVYDFKVPDRWEDKMFDLISQLNSRLLIGHFDYWMSDGVIVYRQSMSLAGEARLNSAQAMTLLAAAIEASEKGYPATQYMLWADKSVNEAIDQSLIEAATRGL